MSRNCIASITNYVVISCEFLSRISLRAQTKTQYIKTSHRTMRVCTSQHDHPLPLWPWWWWRRRWLNDGCFLICSTSIHKEEEERDTYKTRTSTPSKPWLFSLLQPKTDSKGREFPLVLVDAKGGRRRSLLLPAVRTEQDGGGGDGLKIPMRLMSIDEVSKKLQITN